MLLRGKADGSHGHAESRVIGEQDDDLREESFDMSARRKTLDAIGVQVAKLNTESPTVSAAEIELATHDLRGKALLDDPTRVDIGKSYRNTLRTGVFVVVAILTISLTTITASAVAVTAAAGVSATGRVFGFVTSMVSADQAITLACSAFGGAVAINVALAIVEALSGRRAVEDVQWRRNLRRVVNWAAIFSVLLLLIFLIGGHGRTIGTVLGVAALTAGTCMLAVTSQQNINQTVRAEGFRDTEDRLRKLISWRITLENDKGIRRITGVAGNRSEDGWWRMAQSALVFGVAGSSLSAFVVPLLLRAPGVGGVLAIGVVVLCNAVAAMGCSVLVLTVAADRWTRVGGDEDALSRYERVLYWMMSVGALALFGALLMDRQTFVVATTVMAGWTAGQLVVLILRYCRRTPAPKSWAVFLVAPTVARVYSILEAREQLLAGVAARQLLGEVAVIRAQAAGQPLVATAVWRRCGAGWLYEPPCNDV
ncbi:hypothetical protein [Mycobacteroides chelonae]|uniref:hypothetical protein n=1 Tax=Mycobacteroides chelonae TaxID=1774 RepID=UPI001F2C897D|nr:hypothetical protein [Mycobacteroides chelonae]